MADLTQQVIQNTRRISELYNRKGSTVVNVDGRELYSRAVNDHAFWISLSNDMEYLSSFKFKLVFGDGVQSSGGGGDRPLVRGDNIYKTLEEWLAKYPIGSGVDVDNFYGYQCWDYAAAFWWGQVNRPLVTRPGGGRACDCWNISLETNKQGFTVITNWADLKPGDWAFWDCDSIRRDGHVAMCMSAMDTEGRYTFRGQNQGGQPSSKGGALVSETRIGARGFLGALRYNGWA